MFNAKLFTIHWSVPVSAICNVFHIVKRHQCQCYQYLAVSLKTQDFGFNTYEQENSQYSRGRKQAAVFRSYVQLQSEQIKWRNVLDRCFRPFSTTFTKKTHFNTSVVTLEPNTDISVPTHTPLDTSQRISGSQCAAARGLCVLDLDSM